MSLPDSLCAGAVYLPLSCLCTHLQYLPQELRRTGMMGAGGRSIFSDSSPCSKKGCTSATSGAELVLAFHPDLGDPSKVQDRSHGQARRGAGVEVRGFRR